MANFKRYRRKPFSVRILSECERLEPRWLLSAYTFITKATFNGGTDGDGPTAPPVLDSAGDLFGTTTGGGADYDGNVYELPAGSSTPVNLYSFDGGSLGAEPTGNIAIDSAGDIFGVTQPYGTLGSATENQSTVWELIKTSSGYTPQLLQTLVGQTCITGLTITPNGTVFGACGEIYGDSPSAGNPFIFELTGTPGSAYGFNTLVPASNALYGQISNPFYADSSGNLFFVVGGPQLMELAAGANVPASLGTIPGNNGYTTFGGLFGDSSGDVFGTSVDPNEVWEYSGGNFSIVDSGTPAATGAVYADSAGDLIGSAQDGGDDSGSIYEIPAGGGAAQILHAFTDGADGAVPSAFLTEDSQGDLYGVTEAGGTPVDAQGDTGGTVFELQVAQPSTQLAFNQQPSAATAGNVVAPPITVDIENPAGSIVTTDTSNVTLAIASGPSGAVMGGTLTEPADSGEATFSAITLSEPGTYTLTATDGSLSEATSDSFVVSPSAANAPKPDPSSVRVDFASLPSKPVEESPLSPSLTVRVLNSKGKVVTTDESAVSLVIHSGPAGATLSGTTSVAAVNGIATFSDLMFSAAGKYVLTASDNSLKAAASPAIAVAALPPESMVFLQQPTNVSAGVAMTPSVQVELLDKDGKPVTTNHTTVHLVVAAGPAGGKLAGADAAVKNGIATFSDLRITVAGAYTVTATDGAIAAVTSSSFDVLPGAPAKALFVAPVTTISSSASVTFTVDELDRYKNIATEDASDLTVDLQSQPKGATDTGYALSSGGADNDGQVNFSGGPLVTIGLYVFTLDDAADPSLHATIQVRVN